MKKALDGILAQKEKTTNGCPEDSNPARAGHAIPSTSRTYEAECIFYQKTNKYAKRQKTREVLVKCRELRADTKIRNATTKKLDSRILGIVSRDIVAAEAHYHSSCYRFYTRGKTSQQKGAVSADDKEDEDIYEAAVSQSYSELFHYIRMKLFGTPKVLMMTDVTSRLVASMKSFGVDQVQDSTKKHLRQGIEEFGGFLHIIQDHNGKLLISPDSLTVQKLVRENQSLKKQLKTLSRGDAKELQTKAAKQLRADIKTKAKDIYQSWPPEIESVKPDIVPESLLRFLRTLLTGSNKSRSSAAGGNSVNELRYQLICVKRREAESSQLPPCRDCLSLHAQRANFQAAIWRRCLEPKANMPSPSEHGWTEEDGKLNILWMRSAPAPEVVLELLACKCSRVCKLPDCACLVNGLTCTDMCKLQTCTNQAVQQQEPDLEPDSEDSQDE
ncbi:hypothetical protein GWK47_044675 [Chionoecetes opilio]|uniref:Tesmin/TSO1-like CXC domain-containing protein n=1 Tax=Chionoecetes opilio TaxID=41210 RepID=A0A8J5CVJ5_CHIOP|nr:hypothetical protein GWK47_044675 [Chionoecetes opilio]